MRPLCGHEQRVFTIAPERLGGFKGSPAGSESRDLDRALMRKLGLR